MLRQFQQAPMLLSLILRRPLKAVVSKDEARTQLAQLAASCS